MTKNHGNPQTPKKNDEKPWGNPQTPKRMTKKTWGRCPQTPLSPRGGGGKNDPHPKPKRICSVAVNPFNRHKKKRAKGAQFIRLKGMTEHAQQFLGRETRKRALLKNLCTSLIWFLVLKKI